MQDVPHYCLVRHFCVVGVSIVDRIVLPLAHVSRKWLASVVVIFRIVGLAIMLNEILDKRIRACCVVRRIGQCQDVFVLANRKAFDLAKLRVFELFTQLFKEVFPALFVILKGHAKTFNRGIGLGFHFLFQ